jgi:uncharacterized protein YjdB
MKRLIWLAVFAALLLLGINALADELPLLKLEYVPPYGATDLSYVYGRAYNDSGAPVDTDAYVVTAYVTDQWNSYVKPTTDHPTTRLKPDGSFEVLTYTYPTDAAIKTIHMLLIPADLGVSTNYWTDAYRAVDEIHIARAENGATSMSRSNGRAPVNEPVTHLIWSDEFNGTAVDESRWQFDTGNWITDASGKLLSPGWGNNEKEYYLARNATVRQGCLTITAKKEKVTDPVQGTFAYTSARMHTKGKFATTYGRIEARIRCDVGQTLWPAFWMLPVTAGAGWPKTGELDVWESKGSLPRAFWHTMHFYRSGNRMIGNEGKGRYGGNSTFSEWNTYAVEWTMGIMRWYVDGRLTYRATGWNPSNVTYPAPFDKPFYLLLNLAVGGNFATGNNETTFAKGPREMQVDYVRVYDLALQGEPPANTVTLAQQVVLLAVHQSLTLGVDAKPVNGVTWQSANPAVATVDEYGTVTGIAKGSTTITATDYATNAATCTVMVNEAVGNGGLVTDGPSFAAALGGEGVAVAGGNAADGWTVTLAKDVTLRGKITLVSGNYTLVSNGTAHTLDRGPGHMQSLLAVNAGASLTLGDEAGPPAAPIALVLDGGARWGADFANAGVTTASPLLLVNGQLTVNGGVAVRNCDSTGNGAAIQAMGTVALVIHGGEFTANRSGNNGGALYVQQADILMTGGVFSGNRAKNGGAVYMVGTSRTASISSVTFSGNLADVGAASGDGGAVYLEYSEATLTGVLCEGNRANGSGGAVYVAHESLTLRDSVLRDNAVGTADGRGSAVCAYLYHGMATCFLLDGVTCEGNTGGSEAICAFRCELYGTLAFAAGNALYMMMPATLGSGLAIDGTLPLRLPAYELGQSVLVGDAVAALHGQFTLPATETAYVVGSLGSVDSTTGNLITDGASFVARLGGSGFASYTGDAASGYVVTLTASVSLQAPLALVSGQYTLRGDGSTRTLTRAAGFAGRLILVGSGASLTLGGGGAPTLVLDGGAVWGAAGENTGITATAPMVYTEGALLVQAGAVLCNGDSTANGAAIYHCAGSAYTQTGGLLENNRSQGNGGAVYVKTAQTQITGGVFSGNSAQSGGALYTASPNEAVAISNATFADNAATGVDGCGGAYYNGGASPLMTNVTLTNNWATRKGGALYSAYHGFRAQGCVFGGNAVTAANAQGSALYAAYADNWRVATTTFDGVSFSGNTGGAEAAYVSACALAGESAFVSGDALFAGRSLAVADGVSFAAPVEVRFLTYEIGLPVLSGGSEAMAYASTQLSLPSPYYLRADGRLDTEPSPLISDGAMLVAALGGADVATWTGNAETGWRISLKADAALAAPLSLHNGRYTIVSYTAVHTLRRAEGYQGPLVVVSADAQCTLGEGSATPNAAIRLVLDGGAVSGVTEASPLVVAHGGLTVNGGVQLRNNACADKGGAVYCDGSLTVNGGLFANNRATDGGAIYLKSAAMTLRGGSLRGNTATHEGGAICTGFASQLTATGGMFVGNSAETGGALSLHSSGNTLTDVAFIGNSATLCGGVLATEYAQNALTRCAFTGNSLTGGSAERAGTAVYYTAQAGEPIRLTDCRFSQNGAAGGAVSATLLSIGGAMRCVAAADTFQSDNPIAVHTALTGAVRVALHGAEGGQTVLRGVDGHILTPEDVAYAALSDAPGGSLVLNPSGNNALVAFETAVALEAKAAATPVYASGAVPVAARDFAVRVYMTQNGQTANISSRYNISGTEPDKLGVTYYHGAAGDAQPDWATGLPNAVGAWQVLVQIAPDNQHALAGGTARFALTLFDPLDINADGETDLGDIVAIARHVKRLTKLTGTQLAMADVNADGAVTVRDELTLSDRLISNLALPSTGSACQLAVTSPAAYVRTGETLALPLVGSGKATAVSAVAVALACPDDANLQSSVFGPLVTHETLATIPDARVAAGFVFAARDDATQTLRLLFVNAGLAASRTTKSTLGALSFTVPDVETGTAFTFRVIGVAARSLLNQPVNGLGALPQSATVTVDEQRLLLGAGSGWLPNGDGLALNPNATGVVQASLRFAVNKKTAVQPQWAILEGEQAVRLTVGSNGKLTVTAARAGHVVLRAMLASPALQEDYTFDIVPAATQVALGAQVNGEPVALAGGALTLQATDSASLTAALQPEGALPLMAWASSNPAVLTVDGGGALTLHRAGTATVTATVCDARRQIAACTITVEAQAEGLAYAQPEYRLAVGATRTLMPLVMPEVATDGLNLTWSIADESIASVDGSGRVTALLAGRTTLTATAGGLSAACDVVVYVASQSLTLDMATLWLPQGQSRTLQATRSPETADDTGLIWRTSNADIAAVAEGIVTAQHAGSAQITVRTEDGALCASCQVTVAPAEAHGLAIQPQGATQLAFGASLRLLALDAAGEAVADAVWRVEQPKLAKLLPQADGSCIVKAGTTAKAVTVSAVAETGNASLTISIGKNATVVKLSKTLAVGVGTAQRLKATVAPAGADATLSWASDRPQVATVSADGLVTAAGSGTARITATAPSGVSAVCVVTASRLATGIRLRITDAEGVLLPDTLPCTASVGDVYRVQAYVLGEPDNGALSWKLSPAGIATLTGETLTFIKNGTLTLTVRAQDAGGVSVKCTIRVIKPATGLICNKTNVSLSLNHTAQAASAQLSVTAVPSGAGWKSLRWSVTDDAVTVTQAGLVSAVSNGTATVTATTDRGISGRCTVIVGSYPQSMTFGPAAVELLPMETFNAMEALQLDEQATLTAVTWKTSNRTVATVTASGLVSAKTLGNAIITATAPNGLTAVCTVRVVAEKTEGVEAEAPTAGASDTAQPSVDEEAQPSIEPVPEAVEPQAPPAATPIRLCLADAHCTIEDDTIVTVDASAQVIPLAAGETQIVCGEKQLTLLVDDTPRIECIQAHVGDGFRLLAGADECWLAEDETVAKVDELGRTSLLAAGATVLALTRADGTVVETIRLTVMDVPLPTEMPAATEEPEATPTPSDTPPLPEPTPTPEETPAPTEPVQPTEPPITEPQPTEKPTPTPTDAPTPEPPAPPPTA